MKGERKGTVFAVVLIVVLAGFSMAVLYMTLPRQEKTPPSIAKLDLALPEGFTISSATGYDGKLIICGTNESSYAVDPWSFMLLSYTPGDHSFHNHTIRFNYPPYEARRTSLNVVNGSLYLAYTTIRGGVYSSYSEYLMKVNTNDWTLSEETRINTTKLLDPGVLVSDGKYLYIIGGYVTNTTPPRYWPSVPTNQTVRVDVVTGQIQNLTDISSASMMHGVGLGSKLLLASRAGDASGGSEVNFGSGVLLNTTVIYNPEDGSVLSPGNIGSFTKYGTSLVADDNAVYFFNPTNMSMTDWNYTHQVWRMTGDGGLSQVHLVLPDEIAYVIPVRCGDWFMLYNQNVNGTSFWKCTV